MLNAMQAGDDVMKMGTTALAAALALTACSGEPADAKAKANAATPQPFTVSEVASFNEPWAMAFLPDGRALITEKAGRLMLWDGKTTGAIAVSGVPKVAEGGQGGLGDIVLHPGFTQNRMVYLSWVEAGDGGFGAVVGRARLVDAGGAARLDGLAVIWRQVPKVSGRGHFGHRLAFGPDGKLYISSGERQKFDPAQAMAMNLGKVLRLNDDGSVPADNPFANHVEAKVAGSVTAQIWSLGHRNPLGLAFDPAGRLWNSEMGPAGGDELNLVRRGSNYGYPKVSNGSHYDGRDIPDHKAGDGFEAPKVWWNPSISPGSLMIYSGKLFPNWTGDAFIGALGGEALIRVDLNGERATKADQWPMKTRIREVEQGPDGAIWLLEDGDDGRLMKLTPKR
jgi:glucose/arabinose dehydrogenase